MNSYSCTLEKSHIEKLRKDLSFMGFEFKDLNYGFFQALHKEKHLTINVFHSLKCLIQGKGTPDFIQFYLEPDLLKKISYGYEHLNYEEKVGMDESGKGDYFGPLVVASVFLPQKGFKPLQQAGVMDSKKITDSKIQELAKIIPLHASFKTLALSPEKYNELYDSFKNLNVLLSWTHATCLKNLLSECKEASLALCDQFTKQPILDYYVKKMNLPITLTQRTKAESDMAVAAASVMARSVFLNRMKSLSEQYGIELPKGAGPHTLKIVRKFLDKYPEEELKKIVKMHFKTTSQISPAEGPLL